MNIGVENVSMLLNAGLFHSDITSGSLLLQFVCNNAEQEEEKEARFSESETESRTQTSPPCE